jgi:translation initiation factor IF-2
MAQTFRVGDLAQQMSVSVDELIFKLRSIGVEVTKADDTLDLATVRSIITGETIPRRPREVLMRKEPAHPEEAKRPAAPATVARTKRRAVRRPGLDEELPDQVPDLSALAVPASPRPSAVARAAEAAALPPTPEAVEPGPLAPLAPAVEAEAVAAKPKPTRKKPAEKEAAPAAEAVTPEAKPAAAKKRTTKKAAEAPAEAAKPAVVDARTPLEAQLRELSEDEVRTRILAAKQAAARKAAAPAAAAKPGKGGRKAKSAADADEIRDLLAKFEESRVRAKTEGLASTPSPVVPSRSGRPSRPRRERGEPQGPRAVVVEFRDGKKPEGPVYLSEAVTVRELAEKLNVLVKDLMAYLISKKILVVANQALNQELAEQICQELGVEAMVISFEEQIELEQEDTTTTVGKGEPRPPVVTVMGHVDHGKTTLLDAIRSTKVAEGEAGGITQHIGASRIVHQGKPIVFIDTPGHEAFTQMRARGAKVTDFVILVVAADDGVMPQTEEAINHARAAKVPMVVAVNKIDKPNANPDRVKQELAQRGVLLEGWGGDTPIVEVSALRKQGIPELLEVLLLVAEMADLRAPHEGMARATVIEARKERGRGVVATVLVQAGELNQGDCFFAGSTYGRVRAMVDTTGKPVRHAHPSDAVEVMGFEDIPEAGDTFQVVENEARAREVATHRQSRQREEQLAASRKVTLEGLMDKIRSDEVRALNIVLKADTQGSVEVVRDTLLKQSTEEVAVNVLHASVGADTDNDILLASASQAIVIGFNVRPERTARDLAEREHVDVRMYSIIYNLVDEVQKAVVGMLAPTYKEEDLGRAEVREVFHISKIGTVAGCMVLDGAIPRSAKVRLLRDHVVVWQGDLASLRRFKDDVSEVRQGFECGMTLERYADVKVGDVIEAYRTVEVARTA